MALLLQLIPCDKNYSRNQLLLSRRRSFRSSALMDNRFATIRALPYGRATDPFARIVMMALMLLAFAQSVSSQITRTDDKPKPFITNTTSKRDASKPGL